MNMNSANMVRYRLMSDPIKIAKRPWISRNDCDPVVTVGNLIGDYVVHKKKGTKCRHSRAASNESHGKTSGAVLEEEKKSKGRGGGGGGRDLHSSSFGLLYCCPNSGGEKRRNGETKRNIRQKPACGIFLESTCARFRTTVEKKVPWIKF